MVGPRNKIEEVGPIGKIELIYWLEKLGLTASGTISSKTCSYFFAKAKDASNVLRSRYKSATASAKSRQAIATS